MTEYHQKFKKIVNLVIEEQKNDFDFVMLVSGVERIGKSEFGAVMQKEVADRNKLPFDIKKNIAYDNTEIDQKIRELPHKSGLQADEPIRGLYKMDFARTETKELVKLFAQIGVKNLFFTMCIPRMVDLIENLRNHRVKVWVHILERGHAVLFQPNRNVFIGDSWQVTENIKKMGKHAFFGLRTNPDKMINIYSKTSIFVDDFTFPRLEYHARQAYQEYSLQRKIERNQKPEMESRPLKVMASIMRGMKREKGCTLEELHKMTYSPTLNTHLIARSTIHRWLSEEVDNSLIPSSK